MTDERLRALLSSTAPHEEEAGRRSWRVVSDAFGSRVHEPVPRRLPRRGVLALAVVLAVAVAAVTPPGRAVLGDLRDAVGRERVEPARPALASLPAAGRLLVEAPNGPWIVGRDGVKRRLGAYEEASWSPRGLFVVATRAGTLVTLTAQGELRWSLSRKEISRPRWSPSGFRIVYRSGRTLRVVAGDGTGDRLLAKAVGPAAPAWRPGEENVLAYADRKGRIRVVEVDRKGTLWETQAGPSVRRLEWTGDGSGLVALAGNELVVYRPPGSAVKRVKPLGGRVVGMAVRPGGDEIAYVAYSPSTGRSEVVAAGSRLFSGAGRFRGLTWSPDGGWLVFGWPAADQLIFIRVADRKVVAVSNVSREFDPGAVGPVAFPRIAGWCCPSEAAAEAP